MKKLTLFFVILSIKAGAQPVNAFRNKCFTLKTFLNQHHYQPLKWDDSSSVRLYTKWIDELDDEKLFLSQQDLQSLDPLKYKLDDELNGLASGWNFFDRSTTLFKKRVQAIDTVIRNYLDKALDLNQVSEFTWPCTSFASNSNEVAIRWQKYLRWTILKFIADQVMDKSGKMREVTAAELSQFEVKAREKVKRQELNYIKNILRTPEEFTTIFQDQYLDAIAWCYDPHSNYMNKKAKKEFEADVSGNEYSAGFDLAENDKGDKQISFLQPGGSAWRSGELHTGDVLVKVKSNGVEKEVSDIRKEELNNILNGTSDSEIELTIRTSSGELKTIKLNREKRNADDGIVKSYLWNASKKIGYIHLPGFYSHEEENGGNEDDPTYQGCANDVSKEIVKLKKDNIQGLILDLRFNGGGSMWEAMQLAGIFIDIGPVASVKERDGKIHFLKDPNRGTIYDGPLIVLVNGASASASEFVSAVLQDYNRAIIVGSTTYGKGTAQALLPMDTINDRGNRDLEDYVKVTEEKFYRVNGSTVQWKGVIPDIELPDYFILERYHEKFNKSALQPDNSKPGIYETLPALPIAALKEKSQARVSVDPFFKAKTDFVSWYSKNANGMLIPLQWNAFALAFMKNREMTRLLRDDDSNMAAPDKVTNTSFDQQLIDQSSTHTKDVNTSYLKRVQNDKTIDEAVKIMIDWLH